MNGLFSPDGPCLFLKRPRPLTLEDGPVYWMQLAEGVDTTTQPRRNSTLIRPNIPDVDVSWQGRAETVEIEL